VYVCLISLGDFTNVRNAAVPWDKITKSPWEWIKDWDQQIVVKEPTKMVREDVYQLHRYLLERQTAGKGLIWIQSAKHKMVVGSKSGEGKGKGEAQEIKGESEDEEGDEDGKEGMVKSAKDDKMDVEIQSAKSKKIVGSNREKRKGKNRALKIKKESDDEDGKDMEKGEKLDSRIRMAEGTGGSIGKRRHGILRCGEDPPAKRQKKMVSDSPTRYGALRYPSLH